MSNRYSKLCHCNRITSVPLHLSLFDPSLSMSSKQGESKAVLNERNINERNPKTNWIDRVHVIRRGGDATRQLPSGSSSSRTRAADFKRRFWYRGSLRKIRYREPSSPLRPCPFSWPDVCTRSSRDIIEEIPDRQFFNRLVFISQPAERKICGEWEFLHSMQLSST